MSAIKSILGREVLDSRGNPTVEVEVELESGLKARAAVPSGASTGAHEALELRDNDPNRYGGKGVLNAVSNVNKEIRKAVVGMEVSDQKKIDGKMLKLDGTENKSKLGANAILGVSKAVCRAAAMDKKIPFYKYIAKAFGFSSSFKNPIPLFNIINGGEHADSGLSVQEFKVVPIGIENYSEQLRAGSEIFHALKKMLEKDGFSTGVGDEGGFAPKLESHAQALEFIVEAIKVTGYKPGVEVCIALDVAANSFYDKNEDQYILKPEEVNLTRESLINLYREWIDKYFIISIEDGLHEEDWEGWPVMMEKLTKKPILAGFNNSILDKNMVIGDDLLVTNVKRLQKAIDRKACNSTIIKPNQIGTVTETIDCIKLAKKNKMKTIVSHRSGGTTDDFISDLAVATGADFIKSGSLSRGERICKYNRLLRINEEI